MNIFTNEFKIKAIKLRTKGKSADKIFMEKNISIKNKQRRYASKLISSWKRKGVVAERKKNLNSIDILFLQKQNKYLKAKVAYLKKENSFLEKLPKKKSN